MKIQLVGNSILIEVVPGKVRATSYGIEFPGDTEYTDHGTTFVPWAQIESLWLDEGETLDVNSAESVWQAIVDLNKRIHALETELRKSVVN